MIGGKWWGSEKLVKKSGKDKVKTELSLRDLKEKLRKLQTEKTDILLQAKKLKSS